MNEILTCRRILSFMVFTAFILYLMLRVNVAIALTDMIRPNATNDSDHFSWSEAQKGTIIGAYFWGEMLVALPGGRLAEKFGTKFVMGLAFFLTSLLTIMIPFLASIHYYAVVLSRFAIGLVLGVVSPAVFPIALQWIPPTDMSKFLSTTGSVYLGGFFTLAGCGYLIEHFGWRSVFYVTGAIALVWSLSWFYLVYDSPREHPRISRKEKEFLLDKVNACGRQKPTRIPWRKILTSAPVWSLFVAYCSLMLAINVGEYYLPIYMAQVFHLEPKINGLVCSLPYIASYVVVLASSCLADKWIKTNRFKTFTIRRIFLLVTLGGPALLFTFQIFFGDNTVLATLGFIVCFACFGCSTPSMPAYLTDFAPSYPGTVSGITIGLTSFVCYLESVFIGYVTQNEQSFEQWKYVFALLITTSLFGILCYFVLGSSEVQSFNLEDTKEDPSHLMTEIGDKKLNEFLRVNNTVLP